MGRLINKLQMKILPLQRVDIESESEALNLDSKIIESNFHFRCKAFDSDGKRIDSKIMIALESRLS
jgi:hypothetical protein